ncbi:transglutaminaseTgpA domain-containing protein [Microbacterium sp.]|uniref:transglutaminase family protein n=1 Tax=Microbacterium sp. TaxID=51671 RepID=UPI003C76BF6F
MSDHTRPARRPVSPAGAGMLAMLAAFVTLWPYTGAVRPGPWTFVVVTIVIAVAISGILARLSLANVRAGIRSPLVLLVQAVAAAVAGTATLASETAIAGLIPTGQTARLIGIRLNQSVGEIMNGVAPIEATVPMATLLGLVFAVVAILIDQLVANRLVLLAVVFTSVVGVMPILISFGTINIVWFVMQAVVILLLLRFGARHDPRAPRGASFMVATAAGALTVVAALVLAPVLPVASALPGTGPMLTINADLNLGSDLRRPEGIEALTLVTTSANPPYLRLATLSRFDGDVWRPDRGDRVPLSDGFGDPDWGDSIKTVKTEVSIRVTGVSSDRLPVPYAPESIKDAGEGWSAIPENRTVISRTADAAGTDYTVTAETAAPTLEQIRASSASGVPVQALPDDLPPIIGELARQVTARADTDYDKLIALQNWFRSEFTYSLDAPVEEGFDGTGADAVATFLEKRTGYCIHFAGAFALMAQSLDMPVRIVVGYLPGTSTGEKRGEDLIYSVSSDQLHSWPEVFFEGIGWVPFEPTATLGVPTDFVAAAAGGSGDSPEAPKPSSAPSDGASAAPTSSRGPRDDVGSSGATPLQTLNPTPVTLTVLGILVALLLPLLARELRRASRVGRARSGDAMAAWQELSDTLIDLGIAAPEAQTARVRADALALTRGVDPMALAPIVRAVEHASYAERRSDAGNLANPLRVVLAQLGASVDSRQRVLARLLPASLFARRR